MTTHIVIKESSASTFQQRLNETSSQFNVFATQTHVLSTGQGFTYVAVCFIKDQ